MRGGVRHRVLADQHSLGEVRTQARYALFDLGAYPGLVHSASNGDAIHGELYEIDDGLIPLLDRIEGAPSLYRLEPVWISDHPGEVFAYFYQGRIEGLSLCEDNRWRNKRSRP